MKLSNQKKSQILLLLPIIFLFCLAGFIVFYKLGYATLENWDEAWFADMVRNMIRTKELIVPYWNGSPLLDKPPLYLWLSLIWVKIFGLSEFVLRLTSAISGLAIIILVTAYSRKHFGFLPSLLTFSVIAFNNVFIWRVRSANLDILAALLIFLTYLVITSKNRWRYSVLGILFALIYLTKTSLVNFPIFIFIINEIIYQRKNLKDNLNEYFKLFFLFAIISGLWLAAGSLKIGIDFAKYYLFYSDQGVGKLSLSYFKLDYIQYAYYSLQRRFFWVVIFGLFFVLKRIKEQKKFLLLMYSCLLLLILTLTERKNNWYLIPAMPFWAITVGYGTAEFIGIFNKVKAFKIIVILIVFTLSLYVSYKTFTINIMAIVNSQTTLQQAKTSEFISRVTGKNDVVVRLDHLYPVTIYYTDRTVLSSPEDSSTRNIFISRKDLIKAIKEKKIRWLTGNKKDTEEIIKEIAGIPWEIMKTEGDEEVLMIQ